MTSTRPPAAARAVVPRAALALVVAALVAAGCGGGDGAEGSTPTTEPSAASSTTSSSAAPTTTAAPAPTAPLTGLPVADPAALGRPALVVKVDNSPKALGRQAGLGQADVVYVEQVEGGATRLAAVFHSAVPAAVGPVRSARTTDVELVANLNRPLFAYSGANAGVVAQVRQAPLVDVGYDTTRGVYGSRGSGVLRLFVAPADLWALAPAEAGPPPPLFTHRAPGAPAAGTDVAVGARLSYGGGVDTSVAYERVEGGWARTQDGRPHLDDAGDRIVADNVVVQFTAYRSSGFRDVNGAPSPEAVLVGEGEVWVLTGDRVVAGRWSRADAGSPTSYTDGAGHPIALAAGRTWVELVPDGRAEVLR